MFDIKHNRAAMVELLFAVFTITGLSISNQFLPSTVDKVIAAFVIFVACAIFIFRRNKRIHRLKPESQELAKFFAAWYGNRGRLIVFCNDLNWIHTDVENALILKADKNELSLYLGEVDDKKAKHLKSRGAYLYKVSEFSASRHKFSMLETEDAGYKQFICRNKVIPAQNAGGLIEFISTNNVQDPHLIALAEDILNQYSRIP